LRIKRIVVVEDDEQVRRLVFQALTRILGYQVTGAANSPQALDLVAKEPPDLVITDLGLPGIDGVELIRRLRAGALTREVPVIAIPGGSRETEALAPGCYAVIQEPFSVRHLPSVVEYFYIHSPPYKSNDSSGLGSRNSLPSGGEALSYKSAPDVRVGEVRGGISGGYFTTPWTRPIVRIFHADCHQHHKP
jgi:two-component system, cell cycle response regulator DivK